MIVDHSPLSKLQAQLLSGLDLSPANNELSNLFNDYILSCKAEGKSPGTIDSYCQRVGAFVTFSLEYFPEKVADIKSNHIRVYLLSLQDRNLSDATVNVYYRSINTFFNWLVAEGLLEKSPMANIKPPRVETKIIKPFSSGVLSFALPEKQPVFLAEKQLFLLH